MRMLLYFTLLLILVPTVTPAGETPPAPATTTTGTEPKWKHGLPQDPAFFPIAVWLQSPHNAEKYKAAGINLFIGLWEGPTEEQLAALKKAQMHVICEQNAVGLKHQDDDLIVGWMHGDEPDNAQAKEGGGYGPPVATEKIVADYKKLVAADRTRPVLLNLGQGVAWDNYIGRGVRRNHPEDYAQYIQGCDLVSFDIYPVAGETDPAVKENLALPAAGVKRLQTWSKGQKTVWCCIECTGIEAANRKPTPAEVRSEVWQALIQGAQGLVYFCHEFKPKFQEAAVLNDPPMLKAVTALNAEIKGLAPALNSAPVDNALKVATSNPQVPVACTVRRVGTTLYLFAATQAAGKTTATFTWQPAAQNAAVQAEVIGEDRAVELKNKTTWQDSFEGWQVHLYKLEQK